ncbi:hypothetical protein SELMODRAFT_411787 [Selaginella moellendorffii]|uniref:Uncharacterized protein n=1 Tax=Selaginella moellendorffii TaxID=88036 RepID=D8RJ15_SELML|nr:uncharacterized protein LOC9641624 [Selaginella moellendorffii]EFJ27627.1 hypothetical protein SELMODRAFT_411787 [Selaginella moellendorffii]|eukprot:XP_002971029.1 uncharacterized protein LOC9641624 [Selaginella moellendorffii]
MSSELDPFLAAYGREVKHARLQDRCLHIPSGFLGRYNLSKLWVHPNYLFMDQFIVEKWSRVVKERKGLKNFHIVSTPGIGKTFYGHYFFHSRAQEGQKVVWRTEDDVPEYLFFDFLLDDPLVLQSKWYTRPRGWDMTSAWLIVDGGSRGISHLGPLIQCVSPDRTGYYEFSKDHGYICRLGAWSLEELQQCNQELELGMTDEEIGVRFYYCGGLPRLLFNTEKFSVAALQGLVHEAAARVESWRNVLHCTLNSDKDPAVSDILLHYRLTTDRFDSNIPACYRVLHPHLVFGSDCIQKLAFERFEEQGFQAFRDFFDLCRGYPVANTMAGKIYQQHVHKVLATGGYQFDLRSLEEEGDGVDLFRRRPTSVKRLREWKVFVKKRCVGSGFNVYSRDVIPVDAYRAGAEESRGLAGLPDNCFVEPYASNEKSFDSLVTPDVILQVTTSATHPVYWSKIHELVQGLDELHDKLKLVRPKQYKLIYVVPKPSFQEYTYQGFKKDDGSIYQRDVAGMDRVHQYVMTVPWSLY